MPATPEVVGTYLATASEGYATPTLRRRVAAIAPACGVAGHPLHTKSPAIRETLRRIVRKHGASSRRAAALIAASRPETGRSRSWSLDETCPPEGTTATEVSWRAALRYCVLIDRVIWATRGSLNECGLGDV